MGLSSYKMREEKEGVSRIKSNPCVWFVSGSIITYTSYDMFKIILCYSNWGLFVLKQCMVLRYISVLENATVLGK